jgi:hypothetical protein
MRPKRGLQLSECWAAGQILEGNKDGVIILNVRKIPVPAQAVNIPWDSRRLWAIGGRGQNWSRVGRKQLLSLMFVLWVKGHKV